MNCGCSSVGGGSSDESRGNNKGWGVDEERAETKRNLRVGLSKKTKKEPLMVVLIPTAMTIILLEANIS